MTKKEIVKLISDELKESQVLTKRIVQMTFDLIVKTLSRTAASSCGTSASSR